MKKHTLFMAAVCLLLQLAIAASAKTKPITVTGWVSDEGCGAQHTKPGGEDCVLKCLRGGAHFGHPEWKPQRMVLVTDEGHKIWVVVNPVSELWCMERRQYHPDRVLAGPAPYAPSLL